MIEPIHNPIQNTAPQLLKPSGISPPPNNGGADGVIDLNERVACNAFSKGIIPEPPQRPDFGTIVGAIYTGGDVAALTVTVAVAAKQTGVTVTGDLPVGIPVLIASEKGWVGMADFVAVDIVVVVAAENARFGMANLISFGIISVVPTENAGVAVSGFLTMLIVMVDPSKKPRFASAFIAHDKFPPFLAPAIVTHCKSNRLDTYGKEIFQFMIPTQGSDVQICAAIIPGT